LKEKDLKMKFDLIAQNKNENGVARAGVLHTEHGEIETPIFMPVGTRASIKLVEAEELKPYGAQIILGNTYHLFLRPGHQLIEKMGGLHQFMNWDKPILTDSGGFQVFSLSKINKITDEGVEFRSPLNGDKHFLTPELSMEIQRSLGSDIVMCFDECPKYPDTKENVRKGMERSLAWAKRCKEVELKSHQNLFGIIQGGTYLDLRAESTEKMVELDFPGYALGGLAVGEPMELMYEILTTVAPALPENKPRYLMGVGRPEDLVESVSRGIDMFDCVMPTRNARHGVLFTSFGSVRIKGQKFAEDPLPVDPDCACPVCQKYTRSYLRHLYQVGEMLGPRLGTLHNLWFYLNLMKRVREAIKENRFDAFKRNFYELRSRSES
jgi:queuine tRNA-ribosyltransferase